MRRRFQRFYNSTIMPRSRRYFFMNIRRRLQHYYDYLMSGSRTCLSNNYEHYPYWPGYDGRNFAPKHFDGPVMTVYDEDTLGRRYVCYGVYAVSTIFTMLLSHPFVVLRRQCQVHSTSRSYHLVPFTLLPVIYHLYKHQGWTCLWKGLQSALVVSGLSWCVKELISLYTDWPTEFLLHKNFPKQNLRHVYLRGVTVAILTPLCIASLVRTVQTNVGSEETGILDLFREGFLRICNWNGGPKQEMIPIHALVYPAIVLDVFRHLFAVVVQETVSNRLREPMTMTNDRALAFNLEEFVTCNDLEANLAASVIALVSTDIVFYPFETILYRLYVQGTRTMIDNLDNGSTIVSAFTNYEDFIDGLKTCFVDEGILGLYKGFGVLILQHITYLALLHYTHTFLRRITCELDLQDTEEPH